MKNLWTFSVILFVVFFYSAGMSVQADDGGKHGKSSKHKGGGKHYVLNLVGTSAPTSAMVSDPEGGEMLADCYEVNLIDMKKQKRIGTAVDCLSVQEVIGDFDTIRLIGTTTFHLPKGSFTTQGATTVAKAKQPTVSPSIGDITHITGAAGAGNAVIDGTRKFKHATGTSRLSGLVNLGSLLVNGEITFDCIFVVELD